MEFILASIEDIISKSGSGLLPDAEDEELNLKYLASIISASCTFPGQLAGVIAAKMDLDFSLLTLSVVDSFASRVVKGWKTTAKIISNSDFDLRFIVFLRSEMLRPSLCLRSTLVYLQFSALFQSLSEELVRSVKAKERGVVLNSILDSIIMLWKRCCDQQNPELLDRPYRELVLAAIIVLVRHLILKFKNDLLFRSPTFCVFFRYPELSLCDDEMAPLIRRIQSGLVKVPIVSIFGFDGHERKVTHDLSKESESKKSGSVDELQSSKKSDGDIESLYLSSSEVCSVLGISPATLCRITQKGHLHVHLKSKGRYLYFRSEVEWVKKNGHY